MVSHVFIERCLVRSWGSHASRTDFVDGGPGTDARRRHGRRLAMRTGPRRRTSHRPACTQASVVEALDRRARASDDGGQRDSSMKPLVARALLVAVCAVAPAIVLAGCGEDATPADVAGVYTLNVS